MVKRYDENKEKKWWEVWSHARHDRQSAHVVGFILGVVLGYSNNVVAIIRRSPPLQEVRDAARAP
jgi:hypothetical protein